MALAAFLATAAATSTAYAQASSSTATNRASSPTSSTAGGSSSGSTSAASRGASTAGATSNGPHATPGVLAIARAQNAYVAHDLDTALGAYRDAAGQNDTRAQGTLGVGYVLAARNDVDGALAQFREAAQQAQSGNDEWTRMRALQASANLLEAAHRWNDAVSAWNEWITFVSAHPTVGNPANGRTRIDDAIHHRDELEQQYAPVRQRIEQRRQQNAHGPQQPAS